MKPIKTVKFHIILALVLVLVVLLLFLSAGIKLLWAYLLSINLMIIIFYGYDKHRAVSGASRIPETILHLLALFGGSPGALAGQIIFRHKTKKSKFKAVLAAIILGQAVLLFVLWRNFS